MRILLDTNILIRLDDLSSAQRPSARRALELLAKGGGHLNTVPQVFYEYWVVATRATERNGLGFSIEEAGQMVKQLSTLFPVLRDERGIMDRWSDLVVDYQCQGKVAHDARLVAAMERHGISNMLTFNNRDFERFDTIVAVTPEQVCDQGPTAFQSK